MITLKQFLSLTKFRLSFVVSLSLVFGFILAKNSIDFTIINPFLAVLLLALGVSALNQVQEYKEDALMPRTKNRPIASGAISAQKGLYISLSLITLGFIFVYLSLEVLGLVIFAFVVLMYNLFYTKGKKVTIYAAVFGAILGVIPPLIGWLSAQGQVNDVGFIALGLFYFIWQIPHFWLLTLKYHKEYEKASFPTVVKRFGIKGLERITFIWLLLTLISGLFLVLVFSQHSLIITSLLILINIYTLYLIFKMLKEHNYLKTFIGINSYMLSVMILLITNSLIFN